MNTDSDSSQNMAYVEYNSDNKRKDSKVSPQELAFLAQLHHEENEDSSNAN